jgi:hypothetical protein
MPHMVECPLRCPFCHGDIAPRGDDWVACRDCLARHHSACWSELHACSTCGRRDFLGTTREVLPPRPPHLKAITFGVLLGAIFGLFGAGITVGGVGLLLASIPGVAIPVGIVVAPLVFWCFAYEGAAIAHKVSEEE